MTATLNDPVKQEFVDYVKENIGKLLSDMLGGTYNVTSGETVKTNDFKYTNLAILAEGEKMAPNLRIDDFIDRYREGENIDNLMEEIAAIYEKARGANLDLDVINTFSDFDASKDRLVTKVINKELSGEYLDNVPHKDFGDLAVICQYRLKTDDNSIGSITINNDHLEMWGATFDEVLNIAKENDLKVSAPKLIPMDKILFGLSSYKQEDLLPDEKCASMEMYVLSTEEMSNGAKLIFHEDLMDRIGGFMGDDYYVIPSSTQEVIILPKSTDIPIEEISQMVKDVNMDYVSKDEVLSDHAYMYSREDKCLFFEKDGQKHMMKFEDRAKKGIKDKLNDAKAKANEQVKSAPKQRAKEAALA